MLMFMQRKRLSGLERRTADLTQQLHRQTALMPSVEIDEPRYLTDGVTANIALRGRASIPSTMFVANPPALEVELIEAQSGKVVSLETIIAATPTPQRIAFAHTISSKSPLDAGPHLIVVYLLNKDNKRAAKCMTAIQVRGAR
jgi:hypothetical protein